MDKQEYRVIMDEINNAYVNENYDRVLMIVQEIDVKKISDNHILEIVADSYEKMGRQDIAREVLLTAYERTPMGRQMAYKLCELSIRMGDLDNAAEFYHDFSRMAPNDSKKYVLKYEIGKAGGVSKKNLVSVLEAYCGREMDEKYKYELAGLYRATGRKKECVELCDEIMLWFADGVYAKKAQRLKNACLGIVKQPNPARKRDTLTLYGEDEDREEDIKVNANNKAEIPAKPESEEIFDDIEQIVIEKFPEQPLEKAADEVLDGDATIDDYVRFEEFEDINDVTSEKEGAPDKTPDVKLAKPRAEEVDPKDMLFIKPQVIESSDASLAEENALPDKNGMEESAQFEWGNSWDDADKWNMPAELQSVPEDNNFEEPVFGAHRPAHLRDDYVPPAEKEESSQEEPEQNAAPQTEYTEESSFDGIAQEYEEYEDEPDTVITYVQTEDNPEDIMVAEAENIPAPEMPEDEEDYLMDIIFEEDADVAAPEMKADTTVQLEDDKSFAGDKPFAFAIAPAAVEEVIEAAAEESVVEAVEEVSEAAVADVLEEESIAAEAEPIEEAAAEVEDIEEAAPVITPAENEITDSAAQPDEVPEISEKARLVRKPRIVARPIEKADNKVEEPEAIIMPVEAAEEPQITELSAEAAEEPQITELSAETAEEHQAIELPVEAAEEPQITELSAETAEDKGEAEDVVLAAAAAVGVFAEKKNIEWDDKEINWGEDFKTWGSFEPNDFSGRKEIDEEPEYFSNVVEISEGKEFDTYEEQEASMTGRKLWSSAPEQQKDETEAEQEALLATEAAFAVAAMSGPSASEIAAEKEEELTEVQKAIRAYDSGDFTTDDYLESDDSDFGNEGLLDEIEDEESAAADRNNKEWQNAETMLFDDEPVVLQKESSRSDEAFAAENTEYIEEDEEIAAENAEYIEEDEEFAAENAEYIEEDEEFADEYYDDYEELPENPEDTLTDAEKAILAFEAANPVDEEFDFDDDFDDLDDEEYENSAENTNEEFEWEEESEPEDKTKDEFDGISDAEKAILAFEAANPVDEEFEFDDDFKDDSDEEFDFEEEPSEEPDSFEWNEELKPEEEFTEEFEGEYEEAPEEFAEEYEGEYEEAPEEFAEEFEGEYEEEPEEFAEEYEGEYEEAPEEFAEGYEGEYEEAPEEFAEEYEGEYEEAPEEFTEEFEGEYEEEPEEEFDEDADYDEDYYEEDEALYDSIIPEEIREEITEFLLVEGMEEKISGVIENIVGNKENGIENGGHLIVSGDPKSGKTYLTISIIKAVGKILDDGKGRVAKVQAANLCGKEMSKVFKKIAGSDFIIENIGYLDDGTVNDLIETLKTEKVDSMVVLEGNNLAVDNLLKKFPEINELFKNRLEIEELSLPQWAELASEYAVSQGYVVGDMAMLALHAKIDEINQPDIKLSSQDVMGIIDDAIENANKHSGGKKRHFGRKKQETLELLEEDFD